MISDSPLTHYSLNCKKSFQPLNASLLLNSNNFTQNGCLQKVTTPPLEEEQGFDNVAFDLEGLEKIEPGSRKPLVGIHVRTVSAEEFVRSTLHSRSIRSNRSDGWSLESYPLKNADLGSDGKGKQIGHQLKENTTPNSQCTLAPCKNDYYNSSPLNVDPNRVFSQLERKDFTMMKDLQNINNIYKTGEKTAPETVSKEIFKENGFYQNSLPLKLPPDEKKMDALYAKKTESGSPLSDRNKICGTSLAKTMVRVGGVSTAVSPPFSQNANVSVPPKIVISSVGSMTIPPSVSHVSVINSGIGINNNSNIKVSNQVLNSNVISSSPTAASTFATSVVSALSKVSSVRIVPSPNTTPTPSVIGVTASASSAISRGNVVPKKHKQQQSSSISSASTTTSKRSSQPYRPFVVVKRHFHNLKNGDQAPFSTTRGSGHQNPRQVTSLLNLLHGDNQQTPTSSNNNNPNTHILDITNKPQQQQQQQQQQQTQSLNQQHELQQQQTPHPAISSQNQPDPLRGTEGTTVAGSSGGPAVQDGPENVRREERERRREHRERRRGRRALRRAGVVPNIIPGPPLQTDLGPEPRPHPQHLPDLLNSHIPPPYSTLPNGPRNLGGLLGPPASVGAPPPITLQLPPPPPPQLAPFPPPPPPLATGPSHGSPIRAPIPADTPWHLFGSRRSRSSRRIGHAYLGDEEAKACCGLLVTQAVSIRWFIIMISFVGLCCTVVGTVLGAVKTNSSEYVTITLLMIGVGIVLITVSGVAWHLTSRDAPCRVMLGLSHNDSGRGETRRFMSRMAPTFGRPHHPYAAMMYPEFQYRPPPPSYQASMQEYRLRLFLLDRHGTQHFPGGATLPSPPPTYRSGPYNIRGLGAGTLSRESDYSRPPSYRSREGSVTHHPDAPTSGDPGGGVGGLTPVHSRDPSCLSFLSHEGSTRLTGNTLKRNGMNTTKFPVVDGGCHSDSSSPTSSNSKKGSEGVALTSKDDNRVTIVQTTDGSHVIGSDTVTVTISGNELTNESPSNNNCTEISVLAQL